MLADARIFPRSHHPAQMCTAIKEIAETAAAPGASAADQSRRIYCQGRRRHRCQRFFQPTPLRCQTSTHWCSLPDATDGASLEATKTRILYASRRSARPARSAKAAVARLSSLSDMDVGGGPSMYACLSMFPRPCVRRLREPGVEYETGKVA